MSMKAFTLITALATLGISGVWLIAPGPGAVRAQDVPVVGINAHGERTGQVQDPRRAEDDLRELAKQIEQRAEAGDVSGIIALASEGLDIVFGKTHGKPYDGTPLVRDMSNGKGIRARPTAVRLLDGRLRNVVEVNMKWQEFSIEADIDYVRVPVDANGDLQPWTAVYNVKVLRGNHSFIPLALPIGAALPPPPPMPIPGQCDQIEQELAEGGEYSITVHYGEGRIGGDAAQMTANIFGGYVWCGLHPTRMIWFLTPVADTPQGDGFLNTMVNGMMLAGSNGQNPGAPEWDAKSRLDDILTLAKSAPVDFAAIKAAAVTVENDVKSALERRIDPEPGADITVVFRNNQTYGSALDMAWSAGQVMNIRIRNEDPWPHFVMFVDFGEGVHNFRHDLGCSSVDPIRFGPLLMPPPRTVPGRTTVDFPVPMQRSSGVVGGSAGIYIFDFFHHSRMIWTVHAK